MSRLGVMGGTFDPIHNGHLFLALEALYECRLDRVLFIPNRVPPHKAAPGVGPEERCDMLSAAISSVAQFELSRLELERQGPSYTLDTLESLGTADDLVFICGADAFRAPWYRPEAVLERLHTLLLAHRHGVNSELPPVLAALPLELQSKVQRLNFPDIAISSTDIRQRVAQDRPFRFLLPDAVYRYIRDKGFYREGGPEPEEKGSQIGAPAKGP